MSIHRDLSGENIRRNNGQCEGAVWQLAATNIGRTTWTTGATVWTSLVCDSDESADEENVENDWNPRGNSWKIVFVLAKEKLADKDRDGVEDLICGS